MYKEALNTLLMVLDHKKTPYLNQQEEDLNINDKLKEFILEILFKHIALLEDVLNFSKDVNLQEKLKEDKTEEIFKKNFDILDGISDKIKTKIPFVNLEGSKIFQLNIHLLENLSRFYDISEESYRLANEESLSRLWTKTFEILFISLENFRDLKQKSKFRGDMKQLLKIIDDRKGIYLNLNSDRKVNKIEASFSDPLICKVRARFLFWEEYFSFKKEELNKSKSQATVERLELIKKSLLEILNLDENFADDKKNLEKFYKFFTYLYFKGCQIGNFPGKILLKLYGKAFEDLQELIERRLLVLINDFFFGNDIPYKQEVAVEEQHPLDKYRKRVYFKNINAHNPCYKIEYIYKMGQILDDIIYIDENLDNFQEKILSNNSIQALKETLLVDMVETLISEHEKKLKENKRNMNSFEKYFGFETKDAVIGFHYQERIKFLSDLASAMSEDFKIEHMELIYEFNPSVISKHNEASMIKYLEKYFNEVNSLKINKIDDSIIKLNYLNRMENLIIEAKALLKKIQSFKKDFPLITEIKEKILKNYWEIFLNKIHLDCLMERGAKLKDFMDAKELNSNIKLLSIELKNSLLYYQLSRKREIFTSIGDIKLSEEKYEEAIEAFGKIKFIEGLESVYEKMKEESQINYRPLLKAAETYGNLRRFERCVEYYDKALWVVTKDPETQLLIWESRAKVMEFFSDNLKSDCEKKIVKLKERLIAKN